ncbi:unnamed protein product [Bubo scandiacus]
MQIILESKYVAYFVEEVKGWQIKSNMANSVISIWMEVQHTWSHLESIFTVSEDIRSQLPEDANRFNEIKRLQSIGLARELVIVRANTKNVMEATTKPKVYEKSEALQHRLPLCEKALAEYLETKCIAFPRFYFLSSADLLDILSKGTEPKQPIILPNFFDNIADLEFQDNIEESVNTALGMYSREKEHVPFYEGCRCGGQVESWLQHLEDTVHKTLCLCITEVMLAYEEKQREQSQLNALITVLLGELSSGDRQKIMTFCTIDVHTRDVVASLVTQKFRYFYESLGNNPRLIITPLTDRCYITLTQSLHLMSGAAAGPASTGKTETTKDLGCALDMMVYVFNCSEQMDYKSVGNIYKGTRERSFHCLVKTLR